MKTSLVKSFMLASGIFSCMLGVEMLLIDSAMVKPFTGGGDAEPFTAPEWAPWTLLSVGAATLLHFCTAPASAAPADEE
jgi:hypothetical protein